jgi:hypothetical protein
MASGFRHSMPERRGWLNKRQKFKKVDLYEQLYGIFNLLFACFQRFMVISGCKLFNLN